MREALQAEERTSEMTVEGGCLVCGGDVRLKVTAAGARTVCVHCEWIGRPEVRKEPGGLHVHNTPTGLA